MVEFVGKVRGFSIDMMGFIPAMLNERVEASAKEQLDAGYQHGGGWRDFKGFQMLANGNMQYPGDTPVRLIAEGKLRDETIRFYESSWVAVVQPDGSFSVCRMD
jgi:hypothetical protein